MYTTEMTNFIGQALKGMLGGGTIEQVSLGRFLYKHSVVVSQNRNNGNAGEPILNWCLGPSTGNASAGVHL